MNMPTICGFFIKFTLVITLPVFLGCGNNTPKETLEPESTSTPSFQWDFSKNRTFVYSYYQSVKAQNHMQEGVPADLSEITMLGKMNVAVQGVTSADLSLTEGNSSMLLFDALGKQKDSMYQKVPDVVVQGMNAKGQFLNQNTDLLFKLLFPLPDKMLEMGASEEVKMQMPFNISGSQLFVHGKRTLTYIENKEMEGRQCAVLESKVNVSELTVPEQLKGAFKSIAVASGRYYFDLEQHVYVGSDIELKMDILVDQREGKEHAIGQYVKMNSVNEFKLRLIEIKED